MRCPDRTGPAIIDTRPTATIIGDETMRITWTDLHTAFEFASIGEYDAYICRQTGKVYVKSDLMDDGSEELPDDLDDETKYIPLPNKKHLDLGKQLVMRFARDVLPDDYDTIRDIFSRKGAYARFKSHLQRRGALDQWYDFQAKAEEKALRQWCEDNSIEITD